MKLNDQQVENVKGQTGLHPIPEDNTATQRLTDHFGDHTFYLDANGLYIWEPDDEVDSGAQAATAVMLAVWGDEEKTFLKPTPPAKSNVTIELEAQAAE